MKKYLTIIICVVIVVALVSAYVIISSPKEETNNQDECPAGYVRTVQSGLPPPGISPGYYCKIDKNWTDFKACNKQSDCSSGETCFSDAQHEIEKDFRCVDATHWWTDTGCSRIKNATDIQCFAT
jgi:hypothetical protein